MIPNKLSIKAAGYDAVNGIYCKRSPTIIPRGFDRTCKAMNWDTSHMWEQLSDGKKPWYEAENESYVYWNRGDGKWWIDGPSGAGVYIVLSNAIYPPREGWVALNDDYEPLPTVEILGTKDM